MISRNINKPYRVVSNLTTSSSSSSSSKGINNGRSISTFNRSSLFSVNKMNQSSLALKQSFIKNTTILPPSSSSSIINTSIQSNKLLNEIRKYTTSTPKQSQDKEIDNNNKKEKKDDDTEDDRSEKEQKQKDNKDNKKEDDEDLSKLSTGQKIKALFKKYGKIALIVHFGIYFLTMGSFYALFSSGVDVTKILEFLHIPTDKINPNLGVFAVAFACTKLSTFIRTPITIITVPILARYLSRAKK